MTTFAMTGLIKVTFTGRNAAGSISVPGVKVGDYILMVDQTALAGGNFNGPFLTYIDTDDTVEQLSNSDLSAIDFTAFLIRM